MQSYVTALNNVINLIIAEGDRKKISSEARKAARCLDLSEIAPEFRRELGVEAAVLLKEVLDRTGVPPYEEIPGAEDLLTPGQDTGKLEKWTVPKSEITIARITEGPRKGEYLFDSQTVADAKEFFGRVAHLDYQSGKTITPNIYAEYLFTPGPWIEREWIRGLPSWLRLPIHEQAVWQWAGMGLTLLLGCAIALLAHRSGRRWDRGRGATGSSARLGQILAILLMLLITYGAVWIIELQIRITGDVLQVVVTLLKIVFIALIAWGSATIFGSIADSIVVSRRLRPKGIDSQLVRLTFRLLNILVVIGLILYLADRLGIPAYSVITGLGVGGLAVALAARETLANFFGSIMIMLDRPFRVGDWVKVGDEEGSVEDIGFRSTRIRTFYNSLVSIPNSEAANEAIDNMGQREFRRVRTVLQVTYDTPVDRLEGFVEGIKEIIRNHSDTRKDYFHVVLNDFGAHSLDVLVYFFLKVPDWGAELVERQQIFLDIIRLAERLDVKFAFPTRTLHVESLPADAAEERLGSSEGAQNRQVEQLSDR